MNYDNVSGDISLENFRNLPDGGYEYYKHIVNSESESKNNSFISTKQVLYTKKIASGGYGSVYFVNTEDSNIIADQNQNQNQKQRGRSRHREFDEKETKTSKYVLKRNLCDKSSSYSTQIKECNYLRMFMNFPYFIKLSNVVTNIRKENERESSPVEKNVKDDLIHFIFPKSTDNLINFQKTVWGNINYIENLMNGDNSESKFESKVKDYLEGCHYPYDFNKSIRSNHESMIFRYFEDVFTCMVHVLLGIEYLHYNNIIHRDIKLQNILYDLEEDGTKTFRLCDFGFMRKINGRDLSPDKFTPGFYPPESVFKNRKYTTKVDVWTVGICLYIMLRHKNLFSDKSEKDVIIKEIVNKLPCSYDDLIANLDETDPENDKIYEQNCNVEGEYNSDNKYYKDKLSYVYNKRDLDSFLNDFSKPSLTLSYLNRYIENNLYSYMKSSDNTLDEKSKYSYTIQVQHLLTNMLNVNHNKRFSARECLNLPIFNKWRELIDSARKKYISFHNKIELYDRPKEITDRLNIWISVMEQMKYYSDDLYIIDYITIGNVIDCVDRLCHAFHVGKYNSNNPYPLRISGMFSEDKKYISCEFDHFVSVIVYMIIKLQWHDAKLSYDSYYNILKKAYQKSHAKTLIIQKILPKYCTHIELSILHACDGIMYRNSFVDLSKTTAYSTLKDYCKDYLKFSTSTVYNINDSNNNLQSNNDSQSNNNTIITQILNSKIYTYPMFRNIFNQKDYEIKFLPYMTEFKPSLESESKSNDKDNQKEEKVVIPKKVLTNKEKVEIKEKYKFDNYKTKTFRGVTDERIANLFNTKKEVKNFNISQVKSSRSSGSYTCKELREKLNALGISYNTRQKKKELADLLRNSGKSP
jgi:serine/threonine protein kinase